jgi:ParB-like chromosome segregation protein Spo0J
MLIRIDQIQIDGGTQSRERLSDETVAEYADRMREGDEFPPVVVFFDGSANWLADGFHRFHAARSAGLAELRADVRTGTKMDALWFALGANKANGQRPTRGDVRHAVLLALRTWPERSQREIAAQVGCSQAWVSNLKSDVISSDNVHVPATRTDTLGRDQPTRKPRQPKPEQTAAEAPMKEGQQKPAARPTWTPPPGSSRVGIANAMKAIACLKETPLDDALRADGFDEVVKWIEDNR